MSPVASYAACTRRQTRAANRPELAAGRLRSGFDGTVFNTRWENREPAGAGRREEAFLKSSLQAELLDKQDEKRKKKKDVKIYEMTLIPHFVNGSCANCVWPLYYGIIEFRGLHFCRPECALKKFGLKGRSRLLDPSDT